jgi:hypothetical protein
MMLECYSAGELMERLRQAVRKAGSMGKWARLHGVPVQHVSLMLKGQKPLGYMVPAALGFVPAVVYVPLPPIEGEDGEISRKAN